MKQSARRPVEREPDLNQDQREDLRRFADLLARILDTSFQIPGTGIRFGLDPLLGLLPGVGDALAGLIGSTILILAAKLQVPRIVLVRMSSNMAINAIVGAVPLVGDAFSVWFRSNARNAELLRRHAAAEQQPSTLQDWLFVLSLGAATLFVVIGVIVLVLWGISALWKLASGG
ncbi:MAG TPA: DUF4112 domain-containing protein [Nitrospiraceae bacterium]|nr:DUF4112 domain-containing protein [Nitrospiraceae bacterium]